MDSQGDGEQSVCPVRWYLHRVWSGTHQDSHLSSPYLCKQFRFLCLRVVFMDKSNLFFRDSFFCQFVPDIIIYVESPISFGCGQVAEDQLGCPVCFSFFPYLKSIFHTGIDLAFSASGRSSFKSLWSNAHFLPSLVILSILSSVGFTRPPLTLSARSEKH